MSILSFRRSVSGGQPARDWSNQEIADFCRAHRLLAQNGAGIGMDRGVSDIGEPWIVFYDMATHDVFMHVARIDGRCILVCEPLAIKISTSSIESLIGRFEAEVRQQLSLRTDRPSNVVVHPAAKIIMSISAVFLLFKLDNSGTAFAKEGLLASASPEARKTDSPLHARVQSVLARLFDAVDTPATIAAIASVILATDLMLDQSRNNANSEFNPSDLIDLAKLNGADATSDDAAASHNDAGAEPVEAPVDEQAAVGAALAATFAAQEITQPLAEIVITADIPSSEPRPVTYAAMAAPVTPASPPAEAPASSSSSTTRPETAVEASVNLSPTLEAVPLALQAARDVITLDWSTLETTGLVVSTGEIIETTISLPVDIDLASLGTLDETLGFSAHTALSTEDLLRVLDHITANLGAFEVEYDGTTLLIGQLSIADMDASLIGIWSNTMSDGSSISIVGQAELIDDVLTIIDP